MSDIVISGYYGFKNAGDELILKAIINDLRSYNPDIEISVLSANPEETSKTYNVYSVNRWDIPAVIKEISKCRMLLSGAGGLFQDTTGCLSLWYYLLIILIAKFLNKIVFIYAVGIGDIKYPFNAFLIKKCFNRLDFVTVRTQQDKETLKTFGVTKEITVTADPVFGLELPSFPKNSKSQKQKIGIIVRKTEKWQQDIRLFSELSALLKKNPAADIVFVPFQLSKDLNLFKTLKKKFVQPAEIFLWENTEDLFKIFSQLDMVISMRLHGLILAAKYKIPFISIPKYSKIKNFIHTIGEKNVLTEKSTAEDIYFLLSDKLKNTGSGETLKTIPDLKNKAKKTAELCNAVLTR
ncbi:MAG: polysaccharide pyruvyl transferase CsaB [Elusimicrobia bacterium]|nr:polysaccharide pyruvyl transferase CsaB [Elusimicrobiota bacterium]